MGISAALITDVSQLAPVEDRWRQLAELRSNAFVTPEWFQSWWRHQGRHTSKPLVVVIRRDDGEVAGLMPLVLDESIRPRAIRFAGASIGDRFHPVADPADDAEITRRTVEALEQAGFDRRLLIFERVDSDAGWWRAPHEDAPRERALIEQQRTVSPYIDLRGLDWDGYLATRSQKFRKKVRRAERLLRDDPRIALRPASAATVDADLAELFRLHHLRRDGLGGSSLHAGARRSLHAFAIAAQARGWLRLSALELEGRQIASFFGWRVGDAFASYQGGFDPAWARLAPGFAIEALMIREAVEEGAAEFDFLLGTEDWKRRFTDVARPSNTALLLGARRPTRLWLSAEARARRVGVGLSRNPALSRVVESVHRLTPTARRT